MTADQAGAKSSKPPYMLVWGALAGLTGIEIAVAFTSLPKVVIVWALVIMAVWKALMIAAYYMHLKFDSRIFSTMFVSGLVLASLIIFTLMGLLHFFVAR